MTSSLSSSWGLAGAARGSGLQTSGLARAQAIQHPGIQSSKLSILGYSSDSEEAEEGAPLCAVLGVRTLGGLQTSMRSMWMSKSWQLPCGGGATTLGGRPATRGSVRPGP